MFGANKFGGPYFGQSFAGITPLVGGTGVFVETAGSAALLVNRLLPANSGSFVETGGAASFLHSNLLVGSAGSFVETGGAASLLHRYLNVSSTGSFIETGGSAAFIRSLLLSSGTGTFIESGGIASLLHRYLNIGSTGTFIETGGAASLLHNYLNIGGKGTFTETGGSASFLRFLSLTGSAGVFVESGGPTSLLHNSILVSLSGSFVETGGPASPLHNRLNTGSTGSFIETGGSSSLLHLYIIPGSTGVFTITPGNAFLNDLMVGGPGTFVETGGPASLLYNYLLVSSTGVFNETGGSASFIQSRLLVGGPGISSEIGGSSSLLLDYLLIGDFGIFIETGGLAGFSFGYTLGALGGSFVETGGLSNLLHNSLLVGLDGTFIETGGSANLFIVEVTCSEIITQGYGTCDFLILQGYGLESIPVPPPVPIVPPAFAGPVFPIYPQALNFVFPTQTCATSSGTHPSSSVPAIWVDSTTLNGFPGIFLGTETFKDTAIALYNAGSSGDPFNKATLDNLVARFTLDYISWRQTQIDEVFAGIAAVVQNGIYSICEFDYNVDKCVTRITSYPPGWTYQELGHQIASPDCPDIDLAHVSSRMPCMEYFGPPIVDQVKGSTKLGKYILCLEDGRLQSKFEETVTYPCDCKSVPSTGCGCPCVLPAVDLDISFYLFCPPFLPGDNVPPPTEYTGKLKWSPQPPFNLPFWDTGLIETCSYDDFSDPPNHITKYSRFTMSCTGNSGAFTFCGGVTSQNNGLPVPPPPPMMSCTNIGGSTPGNTDSSTLFHANCDPFELQINLGPICPITISANASTTMCSFFCSGCSHNIPNILFLTYADVTFEIDVVGTLRRNGILSVVINCDGSLITCPLGETGLPAGSVSPVSCPIPTPFHTPPCVTIGCSTAECNNTEMNFNILFKLGCSNSGFSVTLTFGIIGSDLIPACTPWGYFYGSPNGEQSLSVSTTIPWANIDFCSNDGVFMASGVLPTTVNTFISGGLHVIPVPGGGGDFTISS